MIRYFLRTALGRVRGGKTLFALTVFGVALGVGSAVSVRLLNRNALAAFRGSVKAVSGQADLTIVGKTPSLDEALFPRALAATGVAAAWPVARVEVAVRGSNDLFLDVLGIDAVSEPPLPYTGGPVDAEAGRDRLAASWGAPGWVAISPELSRIRGWSVGDTVLVSSGSRVAALRVGALIDFRRTSPLASRTLAVMDLAQVQALLGRRGEIDEIDVKTTAGSDVDSVRAALRSALGPTVQVLTPEARERRMAGLLQAFRLNLTALSLVSLFVGVFLVAASAQASLVRRRAEFGLLRTLGTSPAGVVGLILAETALLGALGSALGLGFGVLAAKRSAATVSATLTNVYLLSEIESLRVDGASVLLAFAVGIGGALAGAILPALDVGRRDPRSLLLPMRLHERASRLALPLAGAAALVAALSLGVYAAFGRERLWGGFLLGFALLVVLPLVTPALIRGVSARVPVSGFGGGLAARALAVRLGTSAFAVAALGVAVSMMVAVTLLVGSFRATLLTWLDATIRADIYVTTESWARAGREAVLDPATLAGLTGFPGVSRAERLRRFRVAAGDRDIELAGIDLFPQTAARIPLVRGDPARVLRRLRDDGAAVVSEPLSRKTGLGAGDTLVVAAPGGVHRFPIAGVTYDYSSDAGAALVSLSTLERVYGAGPINNVALYLEPGTDVTAAANALRARFAGTPLVIRENRDLRREVLRVFDQTFAVTRVLQVMALVVAVTGISLTLLVLARERASELALYRALGARRGQVFRLFVGEGAAMTALGLLLGAAGGVGLAAVLIRIINPATFGWTLRPAWPWEELVKEAAVVTAAALVAALYPSLRASRAPAGDLSRDAV